MFIIIFNFFGGRFELTHVLSHSCPPFLDFFGQVMHFRKSPWAILINTYHKAFANFFIYCCILTSFRKCMTKISALGAITITHTIASVMFAWFFHVLKL
jgi:hypothetical protein